MQKLTFGSSKWPDIPDCYGWLFLDARGRWHIQKKPVSHLKLQNYLSDNYRCDEKCRWFVQNGPQRVFVELESTPWIYRLSTSKHNGFVSHTGLHVDKVLDVFQDDAGNLLVWSELGIGRVDDRDLGVLSNMMEEKGDKLFLELGSRNFSVGSITQKQIAARWPYVSTPESIDPLSNVR